MADSNHLSARTEDLADDDPFAELTRIMGQGSFIRPQPVDDDVEASGLDLEKELLGDFADDEGSNAGFADNEQPEFNMAEAFGENDFASDLFKGTGLDEFEQAMAEEPVFASDEFPPIEGLDAPHIPDEHYQTEAPEAAYAAGNSAEPVEQNPSSDSLDFGDFALPEAAAYEPADEPTYGEPADVTASQSFEQADAPFNLAGAVFSLRGNGNEALPQDEFSGANYQADQFEQSYAEDDLSSAMLDEADLQADHSQYATDGDAYDIPEPSSSLDNVFQDSAPADSEPFAASSLSIEDELEKALDFASEWDDGENALSFDQEEESFAQEEELPVSSYAQTEQSWQPSDVEEPRWAEEEPSPDTDASAASNAESEDAWAPLQAWNPADEAADWAIDPASVRNADPAPVSSGGAYAQPDGNLYARDQQSWTAQSEEPQWSEVEAAPTQDAIAAPSYGDSYGGPPEIETVEIPEKAVAVTESLDIPHVPYREEVKPAAQLDDIEELLSGAFGGMDQPSPEGDDWNQQEHAQQEPNPAQDDFDEMLAAGLAAASAAALARNNYAQAEPRFDQDWNEAHAYEQAPRPMPGTPPPAAASGGFLSRRNMRIGALLAGVAILGIGGVFAFTQFGGGGDGEAVIIKADNSPIKERPENPGGTTIPNQDSQVYRQVAGETPEPGSGESQLISSAEEPVELPSPPDEVEEVLEQQDDLLPQEMAADDTTAADAVAKNEERLVSTDQDMASTSEGFTMLTPRRVRSYVVRPDGTMVPREVEAPAADNNAGEQPLPGVGSDRINVAAVGSNSSQDEGLVAGQQVPPLGAPPEGVVDAPPTAGSMPRSAPIPAPRPANAAQTNTQAPAPAQAQAPSAPAANAPATNAPASNAPAQTQVAAVQPAAPAQTSAASGWSVQIASQPTLEGAQQSYQSLAQRYGTMLQGKGVNIVKAEVQGKGTYYRVRIPASSKNEAISLCESLKTQGGSCFVSQ